MAKEPKKSHKLPTNTINSVLTTNNTPPKSRQQIYQENYQKNKEKKKAQQKENYTKKKEQEQLTIKQQSAKYYGAEAIKVLMSFKDYTELNQQKHKLWLDFNWTLKDCKEAISKGFGNIIAIMKLEQMAGNLVRDYWETAKSEQRNKSKSWNSLDDDEQQRLIKYWGYEKARIENNYLDEAERLEKQSQEYLKEIELAKFHEERGKIKCDCWQCQESKKLQGEVKAEIAKENEVKKVQCPECHKLVKKLDEESGVCKKCAKQYE